MKVHAQAERYVEVTLRLDDSLLEERLLQDIAAFNAQVEVAAKAAAAPAGRWLARLT